ncbi:MAG: hypothetical protein K6G29_04000 [Clostridiales bacterium]|nr:hypothetical protein [Clostridiales bacterium]
MRRIQKILSIVLMLALLIGAAVLPAAATEEPAEQEQVEVNAAISEELEAKMNAPQTFDFSIVAAVGTVISIAGFALAKKR